MKTGMIMRIALVGMLITMMSMVLSGGNALGAGWNAVDSMATARKNHTATMLPSGKVLVVGGSGTYDGSALASAELYDPATNSWSTAGSLATARYGHSATLLPNGKVLIAGGRGVYSALFSFIHASAELYDPVTNSWSSVGTLATARTGHSATLLPNGKVLVAGGYNYFYRTGITYFASAELFDPATDTWSTAGSMNTGRSLHSATLLPNGKVLVAGGTYNSGANFASLASAELYDPATDSWSAVNSLTTARYNHSATLLSSGKVLVVGGIYNINNFNIVNAELFDPATNSWGTAGSLAAGRNSHSATLLPNGMVLVVGGSRTGNASGICLANAEVYDPAANSWSVDVPLFAVRSSHSATLLSSGKVLVVGGSGENGYPLASAELHDPAASNNWTPAGSLINGRVNFGAAVLLPSGKVLVAGGSGIGGVLSSAELYDPVIDSWSLAGSMATKRYWHSATLLPGGKVLVVGGYNGKTASGALASTELYDPVTNEWSAGGPMSAERWQHTATILSSGKVLVVGGAGSSNAYASAELYDPATNSWSAAGSLAVGRSNHSATLLSNGKVLVAGGYKGAYLTSAELYDPATNSWSAAGSMTTARLDHTATLLTNGKVLVLGNSNVLTDLYDPATNSWSVAGSLVIGRAHHSATLLPSGKVLVVGGGSAGAELYDPDHDKWSAAGALSFARNWLSAIPLLSGKVLVTGGAWGGYLGTFDTISELYDPTVIDTAPPLITPTITGTLVNGWYTGRVTVSLAATDEASGVKTISYAIDGGAVTVVPGATATFDLLGDGNRNVVYGATDNAGNTATAPPISIPIDTTSPTFTQIVLPQPNANSWYNGNVTVHFIATDALSGLASITPDVVLTSEGSGQTATGTAVDVAGNSSSYTVTGINIDKTAPAITIIGVANGATYNLGLVPQASYAATDALSGVAASNGSLAGGDAQGLGQYTYTVTAIDKAGNTTTTSATYTVNATIDGIIDLISTLPLDSQTVSQLIKTLSTALDFYSQGNSIPGDNKMGSFINYVQAPGQNIPGDIVTLLTILANYIIAHN